MAQSSYSTSDRDTGAPNAGPGWGTKVEFARLDAANDFRDLVGDETLHPGDNRRTKTVTLPTDAPRDLVDHAEDAALRSKADKTKTYGQTKLGKGERETLKKTHDTWNWGRYGFEAMRAKAALQAVGATGWLNYYEPGEGVGGALQNMGAGKEAAARTGAPTAIKGDYVDSDPDVGKRARIAEKVHGKGETRAVEACKDGEPKARDALLNRYGYTEAEVGEIFDTADGGDTGQPDPQPAPTAEPSGAADQDVREAVAEVEASASEPDDGPEVELADVEPRERPRTLRALARLPGALRSAGVAAYVALTFDREKFAENQGI